MSPLPLPPYVLRACTRKYRNLRVERTDRRARAARAFRTCVPAPVREHLTLRTSMGSQIAVHNAVRA